MTTPDQITDELFRQITREAEILGAIRRQRPTAKTSGIEWQALQAKIQLSLTWENRRDLLHALGRLNELVVQEEWEKTGGKFVDKELKPYLRSAEELAKLLRENSNGPIKFATPDPLGLAKTLTRFAERIKEVMAPQRRRGRPRQTEVESFARRIQRVWRNASGRSDRLGAHC